jgi:thiol:disulfide interchange protein
MTQVILALLALIFTMVPASAQVPNPPARMVKVTLLSESATVSPGQNFWVAVRQQISPGWHTYWVNAGDAGEPLTVEWKLPEGFKAGQIQWPLPEVQPVASLTNYGYSGEAWLLVRMQAPQTLPAGPVTLEASAKWLACEKVCVPEEAELTLTLSAAAGPGDAMTSSQADIIRRHAALLPAQAPWKSTLLLGRETLRLNIEDIGVQAGNPGKLRFFPLDADLIDNSAAQRATLAGANLSLDLRRGEMKDQPVEELKGLLVAETASGRKGYWLAAKNAGPLTDEKRAAAPASTPPANSAADDFSGGTVVGIGPLTAILFAVLGGIILNLMPCVFPVLSLKVLSFAKYADPAKQGAGRRQGMAYLAGVLASFAALGALLLALRAAGGAIGWGFQFQAPEFVLLMAAVFTVYGLSLSGVFTFGSSLMGAGDSLTRHGGYTGSFFTGVLAVVVATPCTAPFMGAALGYALTQTAAEAFAIMLALGAGFASPMVLLSLSPAFARMLPRPGAWMEILKEVMAFPMYASTLWLVWVLSVERGSDGVMMAGIALLGISFAVWLTGRLQNAGAGPAALIPLAAGCVFLGVTAWLLSAVPESIVTPGAGASSGFEEPYSRERLAELRAEGRPVFINMTAAWCITCKVNERMGITSTRIQDEFRRRNIAYLKGDWTNNDPRITEVLHTFGRAGVPLYLLYPPAGGGKQPDVLPQLLTESIVMDHISRVPVVKAESALPGESKR